MFCVLAVLCSGAIVLAYTRETKAILSLKLIIFAILTNIVLGGTRVCGWL